MVGNGKYRGVKTFFFVVVENVPLTTKQIAREFIDAFGRNLPLEKDPEPNIDYTPHPIEHFPQAERTAVEGDAVADCARGRSVDSVN